MSKEICIFGFSACPQCLYYSQSNTNISHQPLPARDHCILSHPPISIQHIEDKHVEDPDSKVADEIIDVGIEEFPVMPQSELIKTNSVEKVRKNSSGSKVSSVKSKSSSEREMCKPKKKLKSDSQKKSSPTDSKVKSPKIPRERKKSTSKKETKVQRTIFLHGWNLHGPMEKKKIYSYVSDEALQYYAIEVDYNTKWFSVLACFCNCQVLKIQCLHTFTLALLMLLIVIPYNQYAAVF